MDADEIIKAGDRLIYGGRPYIVDAVNLMEWHFPDIEDCHDMSEGRVGDVDTIRLFPDGHSHYIKHHCWEKICDNEAEPADVQRCRKMWELSHDEKLALYNQIRVGSIYGSDYLNDLGVIADDVYEYSEGYLEWLNMKADEGEPTECNAENFADYCESVVA